MSPPHVFVPKVFIRRQINLSLSLPFLFYNITFFLSHIFMYRCYYPHTLRNLVSPLCGICLLQCKLYFFKDNILAFFWWGGLKCWTKTYVRANFIACPVKYTYCSLELAHCCALNMNIDILSRLCLLRQVK